MNERDLLMRKLCEKQFAAYEIAEFLDTHPDNRQALAKMNEYSADYEALKAEYEKKYGKLTVFSPSDCDRWNWTDNPWPWEV